MKIELKNIKHAAFASEETHCFTASVYIDGKKAGIVSNDGHGGPDRHEPSSLLRQLTEHAATLPPLDMSEYFNDGGKHELAQSAETLIGDLVNEFLRKRENKRLCNGKTVCRLPGETYTEGQYTVFKVVCSPEFKEKLETRYGSGIVYLNDEVV